MALSISDLTPEGRRYFEQLQKLSRLEVQVGFQEGQTYEDGTSLADVAAYNDSAPLTAQPDRSCDRASRTMSPN